MSIRVGTRYQVSAVCELEHLGEVSVVYPLYPLEFVIQAFSYSPVKLPGVSSPSIKRFLLGDSGSCPLNGNFTLWAVAKCVPYLRLCKGKNPFILRHILTTLPYVLELELELELLELDELELELDELLELLELSELLELLSTVKPDSSLTSVALIAYSSVQSYSPRNSIVTICLSDDPAISGRGCAVIRQLGSRKVNIFVPDVHTALMSSCWLAANAL